MNKRSVKNHRICHRRNERMFVCHGENLDTRIATGCSMRSQRRPKRSPSDHKDLRWESIVLVASARGREETGTDHWRLSGSVPVLLLSC